MTPLVLGVSGTLTANANTGPTLIPVDTSRLLNRFREAIEVSALQFYVNTTIGFVGNAIHVNLEAQRNQLTNGYVPIAALGMPIQAPTVINGAITTLAPYGTETSTLGFGQGCTAVYRWKFPKSLILAPGEALKTVFAYDPTSLVTALTGSTVFNFGVGLTARYLGTDRVPRVRPVPYATAFLGSSTNLRSGGDIFKNPFSTRLQVERFTGRYFGLASFGGSNYHIDVSTDPLVGSNKIQMRGARNTVVTSSPIAFNQLFPGLRRSWFCRHDLMDSSDFHQFYLYDAPSATERVQISMIGTRDEVF